MCFDKNETTKNDKEIKSDDVCLEKNMSFLHGPRLIRRTNHIELKNY